MMNITQRIIQRTIKTVMTVGSLFAVLMVQSPSGFAFGPARPTVNPHPANSLGNQAAPQRVISIGTMYNVAFTLPNGTEMDLNTDIPQWLPTTNSTGTSAFEFSANPGNRYVITGGLMEVAANSGVSIQFGYQPGTGSIIPSGTSVTGATASLAFNVSTLDVAFNIDDTMQSTQQAIVGASASKNDYSFTLSGTLNLDSTTTDLTYFLNSDFGLMIQKALTNVIDKITTSTNYNQKLAWQTAVTNVSTTANQVTIGSETDANQSAGIANGIYVGDVFTVHDSSVSELRIGEIKIVSADQTTATGVFVGDTNNKLLNSTQVGDTVKIYFDGSVAN
jgi:hypothetical protein